MEQIKNYLHALEDKRFYFALAVLVIILTSTIVYTNILQNPIPFTSSSAVALSQGGKNFQPLNAQPSESVHFSMVNATLALDYLIWDDFLAGYHISNIVLHVIAALLVGLFAMKITGRKTAFFAALIFAVHPVHTSSVTDLIGRGEILAVIFSLLTIIIFLQREKRWHHHLSAWFFFIIALYSSHSANALPFLIALYALFCVNKNYLFKTLPFFLILAVHLIIKAYTTSSQHYFIHELPAMAHYLTELKMLGLYLKVLIIPTDLSAFYYFPPVESFLNLYAIGALITLILIFTAAYEAYKHSKTVSFLLLFIPIALLPAIHLTPQRGMLSESFAYLPSVALCILLGMAFKHTAEQRSRLTSIIIFSAFILIAGIVTLDRNTIWSSNYSLMANALKKSPQSAPLHFNLGLEYDKQGQTIQALNAFEEVVKINPRPMAYLHIARLYTRLGDADTGLKALKWAVALGFDDQIMLATDPDLQALKNEPGYAMLLQRMTAGEKH